MITEKEIDLAIEQLEQNGIAFTAPKDVLIYSLRKLEEGGVKLNEGDLLRVTIEAWQEKYLGGDRKNISDLLPEMVQISYPAKFISDVSEIRRSLHKVPIDDIFHPFAKMPVSISFAAYEDINSTTPQSGEPLTEFDKLVYMSICTYIDRGIGSTMSDIQSDLRYFTPAMIYEVMNPDIINSDGKPEAVERVRSSIDKMRHIKVNLDYTEYIASKKWGKDSTSKEEVMQEATMLEDDWLLNAKKVPILINGAFVNGYYLHSVPVLYWKQKKIVRQFATYERLLLASPEMRDRGGELVSIKHFLLGHIQSLKASPNLSKKITYDTIFERSGIVTENRKQTQRKRDQVKKFLDYQIKQQNIKGYSEYKDGRKIIGIELCL